jgi:hypothetical protein
MFSVLGAVVISYFKVEVSLAFVTQNDVVLLILIYINDANGILN